MRNLIEWVSLESPRKSCNLSLLWKSSFILSFDIFFTPSTGEIEEYQEEIDAELESSRPKLRGVYAAYAKGGE